MAIENTSGGTPWWPIGAALGLGLLAVLAVGAVFGARRGMFGGALLSGVEARPASAVVRPRPPIEIPPDARGPALTVNDPPAPATRAPDSSGGNGGGGGPSTDGGGNGYDPGTGSGNSTGGSGDDPGYSGSGTTPTQQPPPKPTTPPPPDFPPPNDAPVPPNAAPPIDGDLPARPLGILGELLRPFEDVGKALLAAIVAARLAELQAERGLRWLRDHPDELRKLLQASLPAWIAARAGDIAGAIAKFFSDNEPLRYVPSPKHDKSMPSRGEDGTPMDLPDDEAQKVLDKSIAGPKGKKRWGIKDGKVYEFVPDDHNGGWHGYRQENPKVNVPNSVIKEWGKRGDITPPQVGKWRN